MNESRRYRCIYQGVESKTGTGEKTLGPGIKVNSCNIEDMRHIDLLGTSFVESTL